MTAPTPHSAPAREYAALLERHHLSPAHPPPPVSAGNRETAMRRAIDLLWGALGSSGMSWIGFYQRPRGTDEMVLVCREPKPACSPIGLHGMCGRCCLSRRPIIIHDVRTLGDGYIACDPKDLSEAVVPLINPDGSCDAVLDADSYHVGAFGPGDAAGMTLVLIALGLTDPSALALHPELL
ncbi:MAG: GAF domain-containing protein [Phycisphaeraceae bacterium]|nr:GAF domain-containing protein [Phycisphaeraceae bacterium]